tara:strand:+ start:187 stop:429 length:243 start_codon:yes stop_codon:yes gene_type:complete
MTSEDLENIIRRCCVCKAIEREGKLIPFTSYNEKNLINKGYLFSDTFLSKECILQYLEEINPNDISSIKYEKCPEKHTKY